MEGTSSYSVHAGTGLQGRFPQFLAVPQVSEPEIKIALGDGRTLMLPLDGADGADGGPSDLDLDDDAREKILKIKAKLASIV